MKIQQMHYNFKLELDRVDSLDRPDFYPWQVDEYLNKAILLFAKQRYKVDPRIRKGFETDQARISELANLHIKSPGLQPPVAPIKLSDGLYEVRLDDLGNDIDGQYFRYMYMTEAYVKARKDGCTKNIGLTLWQSDDDSTMYADPSWKWRRCLGQFGRSTVVHPHPDPNRDIDDENDFNADLNNNNRFSNDRIGSLFIRTKSNARNTEEFVPEQVYISYIKYPNRVFIGGYDTVDGLYKSNSRRVHCDLDEAFHDEIVRLAVQLAREDIQDQLGIQISNKKTLEDKI